jgi:hypothetical protein
MTAEEIARNGDDLLAAEQRKLHAMDSKIAEETTTVQAKDRSFSMTFDGRGELTSMTFQGEKYRKMAPAQLANLIVETLRAGRAECMEKLSDFAGEPILPGVDFRDLASGKVSPSELFDSLLSPMIDEVNGVLGRDSDAERRSEES